MSLIYPNKPTWLDGRSFAEFLRLHPVATCRVCGEDEPKLMSVDHVVPRWQGGSDEVSNLQWLCGPCNSRKGPREDSYWAQPFYFDAPIRLETLRMAQRIGCHEPILHHADYFTRPFSQISRQLYVLAWSVAAGKTLSIPVLAHSLNHIIRRDCGGANPRVDRVLVLCKEQAIRDQIADDLRKDIKGYGLYPYSPRVDVVEKGWKLDQIKAVDRADIWVSCIHMFYEKNGQPARNLPEILARFPLIVVDEPHYAIDQVLQVVHAASTSLCFGTTGSPITAKGDQIKRFVLFSVYDYQSACENDQSLKHLASPEDPVFSQIFEEVDIVEAEMRRGGEDYTTETTLTDGYNLNIRPVVSVAESLVRYLHECDGDYAEGLAYTAASHRPKGVIADLAYRGHGIFLAETIEIGEMVCSHLNRMFEADRRRYPLSLGWRATIARSGVDDGEGSKDKAKKLGPDHPWMAAKLNGGRLTSESSRVLVLIGMGREGINNPLCCVVGLGRPCQSMIENVQRAVGRPLRAFIRRIGDTLHVPPATLDRVKILSHSTFGNGPFIRSAVEFVLDMADSLDGMTTMAELARGEAEAPAASPDFDVDAILTGSERFAIAGVVGQGRIDGTPIDVAGIAGAFGGGSGPKTKKAEDWTRTLITSPSIAQNAMRLTATLTEVPRVMREYPTIDPSDETLLRYTKREHPNLIRHAANLNDVTREIFLEYYRDHVRRYHLPELPMVVRLSDIRGRLGNVVWNQIGAQCPGKKDKIFALAGSAMKLILGCQPGESLNDGGPHDIPECHVILSRPEVQMDMRGWIVRCAISNGWCPPLAAGFSIKPDAEGLADAG